MQILQILQQMSVTDVFFLSVIVVMTGRSLIDAFIFIFYERYKLYYVSYSVNQAGGVSMYPLMLRTSGYNLTHSMIAKQLEDAGYSDGCVLSINICDRGKELRPIWQMMFGRKSAKC